MGSGPFSIFRMITRFTSTTCKIIRWAFFFTGQAQLDKNFEIIFETEELPLEKKHFLVRLTPRQTNGLLLRILLEIVPSSYKIVRLVSIEPIGNRNEYILRDVRENVRISDKRFHFKVPKGVEIIRDQRK